MLLSHLALAFLIACGDDEEPTPPPVECDTGSTVVDTGAPCATATHTDTGTGSSTATGTGSGTQTGTDSSTDTATGTATATDTDTGTGVVDTGSLVDADEDGFVAAEDCDDANPFVYPGNFETCDGVDEDCDGVIDNDAWDARVFLVDLDHDGYGVDGTEMYACEAPFDMVEQGGDCDDENWIVNPGSLVPECGDIAFLDLNCDGVVGTDDFDGDGFTACDDCNDVDASVFPGAAEVCNGGVDDDCNGVADDEDPLLVADVDAAGKRAFYADFDMDGYTPGANPSLSCEAAPGFVESGNLYSLDRTMRDCDDANAVVSPGATEVCNGEDDDCDQRIDDEDSNLDAGGRRFVRDADGDGYTDGFDVAACEAPTGFVVSAANGDGDCDDARAGVNPGAAEACNSGIDDDCDGLADDADTDGATGKGVWYADFDGDLHVGLDEDGFPVAETACAPSLDFYAKAELVSETDPESNEDVLVEDCSDDPWLDWYAFDVNPGVAEECNGRDDNCDGLADDADAAVDPAGFGAWYLDEDDDGYTPSATPVESCDAPAGYTDYVWNMPDPADPGSFVADCDDSLDLAYPGAYETYYDGIDADCDAGDDYDQDGDGFDGMMADGTPGPDCNDYDGSVNPDAPVDTPYDGIDQDCSGGDVTDFDGDGELAEAAGGLDCDDYDVAINTAMADIPYDGIDQDCSGSDLMDVDGDGASGGPFGTDCDDDDAAVRPGANELCATAADDDCDGAANEASAVDATRWYVDADQDLFTAGGYTVACAAPDATYTAEAALASMEVDCVDTDAGANPGKAASDDVPYDGIDQDCSGADVTDVDKDGEDAVAAGGTDCDDDDAAVNTGANELCDAGNVDENCDGQVNEASATDATRWYVDADGDHYTTGAYQVACAAPDATYVAEQSLAPLGNIDCDDASASVRPGASETCNAADDDCDGTVDEGVETTFYADVDSDGYTTGERVEACAAPAGYVAAAALASLTAVDCDDTLLGGAAVNPGVDELCSTAADDDCDGISNDTSVVDATTWRQDADGDGFSTFGTVFTCEAPVGYVDASTVDPTLTDCNDASPTVGSATTWFADDDGDTFGFVSAAVLPVVACEQPASYVANVDDCDDTDNAVNPSVDELCSTVADDNCDGLVNDPSATDASTWFTDLDGDGHAAGVSEVSCTDPGATAYLETQLVSTTDDCDDTNASRYPGNTEVCDAANLDEDCDGQADDADADTSVASKSNWYTDVDGDGYGSGEITVACDDPGASFVPSLVSMDIDCDDNRSATNPGAVEVCMNLHDDDCSGYDATGAELPAPWNAAVDTCDTFAAGYTLNGVAPTYDVAIRGEAASDSFGSAVSGGGDLDGDNVDDMVVAAFGQDAGFSNAGAVYWFRGGVTAGASNAAGTFRLRISGNAASEQIGYNAGNVPVAIVPDVTGDGRDDLLVGSPVSSTGRTYLFSGATLSAQVSGTTVAVTVADATLSLASASDAASAVTDDDGWAVAPAGDLNGDGKQDVIVGAPTSASGVGRAGIYLGGVRTYSGTLNPNVLLQGGAFGSFANNNQRLGHAVAGAGDIDGDGFDDVVVGMPYSTVQGPQTFPASTGHLAQGGVGIYYGSAMGSVAANPASRPAAVTPTSMAIITGENAFDRFGVALSGMGDQDGDGYDDFIVGADLYGHSVGCTTLACEKGRVYVINGGVVNPAASGNANRRFATGSVTSAATAADVTFAPMASADQEFMGRGVRGGDFNRDGYGDVIMGVPQGGSTGFAYLVYGPIADGTYANLDSTAHAKITGSLGGGESGNTFGSPIGFGGDVNNDGYEDALFGHMSFNNGTGATGRAYAFFGKGQ